jgi:hypothetical protein
MWLWNVTGHLSFDMGYRVNEFHPFESEQQFGPVAQRLVEQARDEVAGYRERFRTVVQLSDYYIRNPSDDFWPCLNAAIAHTMSVRTEMGSRLLSRCVTAEEDDPAWLSEARQVAKTMTSPSGDQVRFREFISERVRETRHLHKLPRLDRIDFGFERIVPE